MADNPYLEPEQDPDAPTVVAPSAQDRTRVSSQHASSQTAQRPIRRQYQPAPRQAVPSEYYAPQQEYFDDGDVRGGRMQGRASVAAHSAASRVVLVIIAWVCRILAILTSITVIAGVFGMAMAIPFVSSYYQWLTSITPSGLLGSLSFATVLGGAFRGDFALIAVFLFLVDWVCLKASSSLR